MIVGYFEFDGRPYVRGRLSLPRLAVAGEVDFLVDTGASSTTLHPRDGVRLRCPFDALVLPIEFQGVGGLHTYYRETAVVVFDDGVAERNFRVEISIAKPDALASGLDSLLGRDVLNRVRLEYDFPQDRLELATS